MCTCQHAKFHSNAQTDNMPSKKNYVVTYYVIEMSVYAQDKFWLHFNETWHAATVDMFLTGFG